MKDFLKYGALAAGAYFLYRYVGGGVAAAPASSSDAPATVAQAVTSTLARMAAAAQADPYFIQQGTGAMNVYHWNEMYRRARGLEPPDLTNYGLPGERLVTLEEYWAALLQSGVESGLGRLHVAR